MSFPKTEIRSGNLLNKFVLVVALLVVVQEYATASAPEESAASRRTSSWFGSNKDGVEPRQTVTLSTLALPAVGISLDQVSRLLRAFLWLNMVFILLQAVLFPVLVITYKDIWCVYNNFDCHFRFAVDTFEPDYDEVFVADDGKTVGLNVKQILGKESDGKHQLLPADPGYAPVRVYPALGGGDPYRPLPDALRDNLLGERTDGFRAAAGGGKRAGPTWRRPRRGGEKRRRN